MIVKVPVYVEIEKISDTESISEFTRILSDEFYKILRKKNLGTTLDKLWEKDEIGFIVSDLKILSIEQALEQLRKKK